MSKEALKEVRSLLSLCLPNAAPAPAGTDAERLLARAWEFGVFNPVFSSLQAHGLTAALPADSPWLRRHRENLAHNLALEREQDRILDHLGQAGLPCRPVKGVRLVRLLYPDLSWRALVDIDLLAPREHAARVYAELKSIGLQATGPAWNEEAIVRQVAEPSHAFPEFTLTADHGIPVELHWDWVGDDFPAGDPTDDREAYLVYLCRHAGKHFWAWPQLPCDIEVWLRKFGARLDWNRFWWLARRAGVERSCAATFQLCAELFERPLRDEEQRAAAAAGRKLSRRALERLAEPPETPRWGDEAWGQMKVANWRHRLSRVWRWLAPAPWHWSATQEGRPSAAAVWLGRYRRLGFRALAAVTPSSLWRQRFEKAAELSLRDWWRLGEAFGTLAAVRLALAIMTFERVRGWALAVQPRRVFKECGERSLVLRQVWLVDVAANHHVVPMRCLPRSLTLARMLARRGIETELCIGVTREDQQFKAHAWVEWRGEPINDAGRPDERYAALELAAVDSRSAPLT